MNIFYIAHIAPDLGAETREPTLYGILFRYYLNHFDADSAKKLTSDYLQALANIDEYGD